MFPIAVELERAQSDTNYQFSKSNPNIASGFGLERKNCAVKGKCSGIVCHRTCIGRDSFPFLLINIRENVIL